MATSPNKSGATIVSSQSLTVGATVTGNYAMTSSWGGKINVRFTNGATGPTIAPTVTINTSSDGSAWRKLCSTQSNLGNSVVTDIPFEIGLYIGHVQVSATGNTGQTVTVEATIEEVPSIG